MCMHAVWRVEWQYNGASDYTVEDSTPSTEHGYLEGMGYTNVTTVVGLDKSRRQCYASVKHGNLEWRE